MSTADSDREEARAAARADTTWYRRIAGHLYDLDDVPAESDVDEPDRYSLAWDRGVTE